MSLKYPYKWSERRVVLQDRVLFVPDRLDTYDFPDFETLFETKQPLNVEYCSGNGAWIVSKAIENPHINWIAIEMKFERVSKTWNKGKGLKNLLVICGEGFNITSRYFPTHAISEVFVNFPDPWPKKRHWKHRIIQQPFLDEVHRILEKKGKLTFVTDDVDYSQVMTEELQVAGKFSPLHPAPYFLTSLSGYGSSFFEELWRSKGKEIHYHQWVS